MHRRDYRRLLVTGWAALLHLLVLLWAMTVLEVRDLAPRGTWLVLGGLYVFGWRWLTLAVMDDIIAEGASE